MSYQQKENKNKFQNRKINKKTIVFKNKTQNGSKRKIQKKTNCKKNPASQFTKKIQIRRQKKLPK
jgi:hypothetical protein